MMNEVTNPLDYSIGDWVNLLHGASNYAGWWNELEDVQKHLPEELKPKVAGWLFACKIALIHSEGSEMMEGLRKGKPDDHLPHRSMEEVEAADIFIRLADYCGMRGIDLAGAVLEKHEYNKTRADHTLEARAADGGKKF